jgi:hypothetical protein
MEKTNHSFKLLNMKAVSKNKFNANLANSSYLLNSNEFNKLKILNISNNKKSYHTKINTFSDQSLSINFM